MFVRVCVCSNQETRLRVEAADEQMGRMNRKLDVVVKMMMGMLQSHGRSHPPSQVRRKCTPSQVPHAKSL
jgi:hypothetical protein